MCHPLRIGDDVSLSLELEKALGRLRCPIFVPFDQWVQWGPAPGSLLVLCPYGYVVSLHYFRSCSDILILDLCAAIISEGSESVVLSLESWLPPGETSANAPNLFQSSGVPDMWANYAVYLTARVCHLRWLELQRDQEDVSSHDMEPMVHSWHKLWSELQDWRTKRHPELREIEFPGHNGNSQGSTFPFILYAASCAISSNQLYHTACLLLLEICPSSINPVQFGQVGSRIWHARRICGISSTNEHHGCLNNAIQPLWVAGKLLSHPAEHKEVTDLIRSIEAKTGWGGKWRIADLKEVWG